MYTVYIIKSETGGKFYIGYTKNIIKRLQEHNLGKTKSTKRRGPYKVIYTEVYQDKQSAYKREREIKRYKGGQAFKKLIKHCRIC